MLKDILKRHQVILASGSPRRHQFLKELDIPFTIKLKSVEEIYPQELTSFEITNFLSELKAEALREDLKFNDILITSDTIVWNEEKALGKPIDATDAFTMLESLSGKTHEVITSVTFTTKETQRTVHDITKVTFKELSAEEIIYYIENFEPFDKAGAYGIQEWIGLIGITKVEGSYFNVVGMPTHLVYKNLAEISQF